MASAARRMNGSRKRRCHSKRRAFQCTPDHIHLILQHQAGAPEPAARGEQLGGAEEGVVQVQQVEAAGAGEHLRQAGSVAAAEQRRQLDHVDAGRSATRGLVAMRREHRDVDTGLGQGARLVIGHCAHTAPVGGKNRGDVRDSQRFHLHQQPLSAALRAPAIASAQRPLHGGRAVA